MKKKEMLKKIAAQAKRDTRNRRDHRFLETMGFLAAKGLLAANYPVPKARKKHLFLEEVLWAGREVEPRILEVLPAAVLRLGAHFDFDPEKHVELAAVIEALRKRQPDGPDFLGVPYAKLKVWADFPLLDRRVKLASQKKIPRTFRLKPEAIVALKELARAAGCSETEVLERRILG